MAICKIELITTDTNVAGKAFDEIFFANSSNIIIIFIIWTRTKLVCDNDITPGAIQID